MTVTDTRSPVAQTFDEVKGLIHYLVNEFQKKHALDKAELVSAAYYGFMQAFDTFKPGKGDFTVWVWEKVVGRMNDYYRSFVRQKVRAPKSVDREVLEAVAAEKPKRPDLKEWASGLKPDARRVARLVLKRPIDISLLLVQMGAETPGNWRQALREYLTEIGWDGDRVKKAFVEVRNNL